MSGIASAGGGFSFWLLISCVAAGVLLWRIGRVAAFLVPLACLSGILYYHSFFLVRDSNISIPFGERISFSGIVAGEPGHSAKSEYFTLELSHPFKGKIRVVASPQSGFRYGDRLNLKGYVERPDIERDMPVSLFPQIEVEGRGEGPLVRQALSDLKQRLLEIFPRYLPKEEAAFLGGITLGAKASFSSEFREALGKSGTTHLVALSGYNIAILVFVVFGICLSFFGRRASFYITTIAILAFVLMVGAEPSVVRASGMAFVLLLARELGRPHGLMHALLWTAFIMVLFDPGSLFAPGFQLSFISLLGIVYLSPVFSKSKEGELSFSGSFRENAALTVSAQLAVAPIALWNFGEISLASFFANMLILPFMPITMFLGFALLFLALIFSPLGMLAGLLVHILLAYEVFIIRFFAEFSMPLSLSVSGFGIFLYYLSLLILIRHRKKSA